MEGEGMKRTIGSLSGMPEKEEALSNPSLHDYEDGQIEGFNQCLDTEIDTEKLLCKRKLLDIISGNNIPGGYTVEQVNLADAIINADVLKLEEG